MARLSDLIESFIKQLIEEEEGSAEIKRNELAIRFHCVPSQINYVIDTRFGVERGYYVESRRGGGGHIRIRRVDIAGGPAEYLMHVVASMGERISQQSAEVFINNFLDYKAVSNTQALLMKAAISDKVLGMLPLPQRDILRASLLKNMLMSLIS